MEFEWSGGVGSRLKVNVKNYGPVVERGKLQCVVEWSWIRSGAICER